MKRLTLCEIGAAMRAEAEQAGTAHRHLSKGLYLSLYRRMLPDSVLWLLTLARDDAPPSATEVQTVRRDFAVPLTATVLATNRLISISWLETAPVTQAALLEVAA